MSKKQTEKSRYKSKYSPGKFVTADQYITELVCEKKAVKEKTTLPIKFWQLKDWKNFYRYQISVANKLIAKHKEEFIIKALKDSRSNRIYSLKNPYILILIKQFEKYEKSTQNNLEEETVCDKEINDIKFRKNKSNKKNLLDELDE